MKYLTTLILFVCASINFMEAQTYIQYVDSADNFIKNGNWQEAERTTIAALRTMPANKLNYMLWSNLGDIRTRLEDFNGALQALEIALTTAPDKQPILNNRAYTYLVMGDNKSALQDIEESLRCDSVQEWCLNMRGTILYGLGDYNDAEKDFSSLKNHFPDNASAYKGLGKIAAIKGNTDEATGYLERSLELKQDEETWFYLILVNIESDKLPTAKEHLLNALKRYPRSGNLYLLRGLLHKKNYENESAEIDKKIAIQYGADSHLVERFFPNLKK